jgi:hypothetical protein
LTILGTYISESLLIHSQKAPLPEYPFGLMLPLCQSGTNTDEWII